MSQGGKSEMRKAQRHRKGIARVKRGLLAHMYAKRAYHCSCEYCIEVKRRRATSHENE